MDLNSQRALFQNALYRVGDETNRVFRVVIQQLLLLATAGLTVAGVALSNEKVALALGQRGMWLLLVAMALMFLSIALGIIQLFVDFFLFRRSHKVLNEIMHKSIKPGVTNYELSMFATDKQRNKSLKESSYVPIIGQVISISLGLLFLGAALAFVIVAI